MGQNSGIAWTDHTFNPWWGCTKISDGCKNCYAETFASGRLGLMIWGARSGRRFFGDAHWAEPMKWNKAAEKSGRRARVFCASMADVFEDYIGPEQDIVTMHRDRIRLMHVIKDTPHLDWLLLTKRPENVLKMWPQHLPSIANFSNVWVGCTVENQEMAEKRLPHLLSIPASVRFVSYEPALGPVDFTNVQVLRGDPEAYLNALTGHVTGPDDVLPHHLDWVIVGGESGSDARPFNPAWADWTVTACHKAGVPVFVKQMGRNPTLREGSGWGKITARKGDNLAEWPAQLRVQEFPR